MKNTIGRLIVVSAIVCALWMTSSAYGVQWVSNKTFYSASLGKVMRYDMILPDNYTTGTPYAVLYMLHGRDSGYTSWWNYSNMLPSMVGKKFIVVMPEGDNSWYEGSWMNYIAGDLVAHIQSTWPVRRTRGIGGFSMGGYGAFNIAGQSKTKYGRTYLSVSSMSGAFVDPLYAQVVDGIKIRTRDQVADSLAATPSPILFDCGNEDEYEFLTVDYSLADQNDAVRDRLISRGRHLWTNMWYYRPTGEHNWLYWNSRIPTHLAFHGKLFAAFPEIVITSFPEYVTTVITSEVVRVAGTAYAENGIAYVAWQNKSHGKTYNGVCTGTTNWYADIDTQVAKNKLKFTAFASTGTSNWSEVTLFRRNMEFRVRRIKVNHKKIIAKTSDFTFGDVDSLTNGVGGDGLFILDRFGFPVTNLFWKRNGKYNASYKLKTADWKVNIKVKGKAQKDQALYKFVLLNTNVWPTNILYVVGVDTNVDFKVELGSYGASTNLYIDEKGKHKYTGPWF